MENPYRNVFHSINSLIQSSLLMSCLRLRYAFALCEFVWWFSQCASLFVFPLRKLRRARAQYLIIFQVAVWLFSFNCIRCKSIDSASSSLSAHMRDTLNALLYANSQVCLCACMYVCVKMTMELCVVKSSAEVMLNRREDFMDELMNLWNDCCVLDND